MNIENKDETPKPVLRFFVECFGEANKRIMEFLEQKGVNAECQGTFCDDQKKHNLIELSEEDLEQVIVQETSNNLRVEFFLKIDERLPVGMTAGSFKALYGDSISQRFEDLSEVLTSEMVERLKNPAEATHFKLKPEPEPKKEHGVPPMNTHRFRRQRSQAQVIVNIHTTENRR